MRKKSIAFKLFVLMLLMLSFFIGVMLYSQTVFFERFYLDRKYESLEKNIGAFVELYESNNWNKYNLDRHSKSFRSAHNIILGVFDNNYSQLNDDVHEIVVSDYSGQIFRMRLSALLDDKEFMLLRPKAGDRIEVEGTIWNDKRDYLTPLRVTVNNTLWFDYKKYYGYQKTDMLDKISGQVVLALLPTSEDLINGSDSQLPSAAFNYWVAKNDYKVENLSDTKFIYYDKRTKTKCTVFVKTMLSNDGIRYIFGVVPHQAVLEAIEIMKDYYVFVFIGAIILVAALSYFVSLMVAQPLIHINRVANKIAHLDFNERLKIESNDEIGSLSESLNIMADSLRTNLEDLTTMNGKLMEDIQRERQLETMRKDFINGVSHELKTPLGIIKSFTEAIKDGIGKNKQEHYLEVILDEVDRMDALIINMLEISRLQSGTYKLKLKEQNVYDIVYSICERMQPFIEEKKMQLQINAKDKNITVLADERTFELAINNLMSNAVKYGRYGGVIQINLFVCEKSSEICFSIENEADPISDDKLSKIWDQFYRIEASRSKDNGGSGLGLAIVKSVLDLHNSYYGVKNTQTGVMFFFELKGGLLDADMEQ